MKFGLPRPPSSAPESLIGELKEILARILAAALRQFHETLTVPSLDPIGQHRAIDFRQNIVSNFHNKIRTNAQNVCVKSSMVNLAQRHTVYDRGNAQFCGVWNDMRCVEQFSVGQRAHRAPSPVGAKYCRSKYWLMQTSFGFHSEIPTEVLLYRTFPADEASANVWINDKLLAFWLFPKKIDREDGLKNSRPHPHTKEPNKG